jgi:hypothetical protein
MTDIMDQCAGVDLTAFGSSNALEANEAGDEHGVDRNGDHRVGAGTLPREWHQYRSGTSVPRHLVPQQLPTTSTVRPRPPQWPSFQLRPRSRLLVAHGVVHAVSTCVEHPVFTGAPIDAAGSAAGSDRIGGAAPAHASDEPPVPMLMRGRCAGSPSG